jgi:hypothetical protein
MIAFALVGGLALAACSSSGDSPKSLDAKRAASKEAPTTTPSTTPFVDDTTHVPGSLAHYVGARSDVHDTTCAASGDGWTAAGKVTNSAAASARYRVYVSFLRGDTTVGIGEAAAGPVKPGGSADWSTNVKLHTDGLRCILRVERAAA